MKTKEEVYKWLRQHDWYQSFRENTVHCHGVFFDEFFSKQFKSCTSNLIGNAFHWNATREGSIFWSKVETEFLEWLNTDNTNKIMKQIIEIEVPEGKKAVWKDGKVVFEDIMPELPKSWEEFCDKYPIKSSEWVISSGAGILPTLDCGNFCKRHCDYNANSLPSVQAAEAHLALIQLHQLRDCYRQEWVPDWSDKNQDKYYIANSQNLSFGIYRSNDYVHFLSFPTKEIAENFLQNFEDLIRKTGDLIG